MQVKIANQLIPHFIISSRFYLWLKMMSDASDMLAAALEQMDGIIAGNIQN